MEIHFPKGEGIKIIRKAEEAKVNNSIYILPADEDFAEVIIRTKSGKKRKLLPKNIALIDLYNENGDVVKEGNAYKKVEVPNDGKTYLLKADGTLMEFKPTASGKSFE